MHRYLELVQESFDKYAGACMGYSSLNDFIQARMQPKQKTHSQEYVYGHMDTIICSFRFVIAIYKLMEQSFGPVRELEHMESFIMSTTTVTPCIRKMLIAFDTEDYDITIGVSDMLLFVADKFKNDLELLEIALGLFIPPCAKVPKA